MALPVHVYVYVQQIQGVQTTNLNTIKFFIKWKVLPNETYDDFVNNFCSFFLLFQTIFNLNFNSGYRILAIVMPFFKKKERKRFLMLNFDKKKNKIKKI